MSETRGYALSMRVLHWLMAVLIIAMIVAGIAMVNGPWGGEFPPSRGMLYDLHRGTGIVLMFLAIIRLGVKFTVEPPSPLPDTISRAQRIAAETVHIALYLSFIVMPLFGWYATNTWGVANIPVFGLFDLPQIAEKNRELGNVLLAWHGYMGFAVTALIFLHVGAALHHHFVKKDGTLSRMTSG